MKNLLKASSILAVTCMLGACASHDNRDHNLLGGANKANIAAQSVRDVNLPNSRAVETTSGVRAAKAVQALNEGKTKELKQASTSGGSTN